MTLAQRQKVIHKRQQQLARIITKLARVKRRARQLDTHYKIRWGGLVIMAGIAGWDETTLLTALEAQWQLMLNTPDYEILFQSLGEKAFREYQKKGAIKGGETKQTLRRKIQLGGLLKKSGWTVYSSDVLLGMLVHLKQHDNLVDE